MSNFQHKNPHPDCHPKDKFSRSILPPDLSSVFARIDPLPPPSPMYASSILSNQLTTTHGMNQLPIKHFEQVLDEKDLNSIQL